MKAFNFILFYYFLVNTQCKNIKIISDLYYSDRNSYQGFFSFFGKDNQILGNLDMTRDYSYITSEASKEVDLPKAPFGTKEVYFLNKPKLSPIFEGKIYFTDLNRTTETIKICVPYLNTYESKTAGIGLAYKFDDPSFSFIHRLKKNGYIDQLAFTLDSNNYDFKAGYIYYGGTPKSLIKKKYSTSLQVDESHKTWGFNLKSIKIGDYPMYLNSHYSYFTTDNDRLFVPESVMAYFNNTVFKNYYLNGTCKYFNEKEKFINCQCNQIKNFPNLTFEFGNDAKISINSERSFKKLGSGNTCLFLAQYNYIDEEEKWLFGSFFFRFFITEFNYEKKSIILYSNSPLGKASLPPKDQDSFFNLDKLKTNKRILFFLCFFLALLTVFLIKIKLGISRRTYKKKYTLIGSNRLL